MSVCKRFLVCMFYGAETTIRVEALRREATIRVEVTIRFREEATIRTSFSSFIPLGFPHGRACR